MEGKQHMLARLSKPFRWHMCIMPHRLGCNVSMLRCLSLACSGGTGAR